MPRKKPVVEDTPQIEKVKAKYDAASMGRRMRGWNPPASGPKRAVEGAPIVRNRARDAGRNEWSGTASTRVWKTNLVGTGIVPRPTTKDATLKQKLNDLWNEWTKFADADGVWDFAGLQALVVHSWVESGEVFARVRPRRIEDGLDVPMQIQIIESDCVPMLDADTYPGMPAGNVIRQGIEINRIGKRVAYWMYRNHPGDSVPATVDASELVRVPSGAVMHIYEPTRPGQLRGVSIFAPILTKLRGVMDFDDAVLERQKLSNLFTLFVTKAMPTADGLDPITGLPIQYDSDGGPIAGLEPGTTQELLPGEDVKFSDPPDSGANYAEFMRRQLLGVSAGNGVPYEVLTGDIKDVSDRTLRVVINEFRRLCEQKQWLVLIPMFCTPVRDAWADAAVMSGQLTLAQLPDAKKVNWNPQGWQYIHPVQDVQAKQAEVEAGFRSRSSVISEQGFDPEDIDQQRADDKEREDKLGLTPPPPPDPSADPEKTAEADKKKAETKKVQAETRLVEIQHRHAREIAVDERETRKLEAKAKQAEVDLIKAQYELANSQRVTQEMLVAVERTRSDLLLKDFELRSALAAKESSAKVEALCAELDAAKEASASAQEAYATTKLFEQSQREILLSIERDRKRVSELELEAAQMSIEMLK